MSQSSYEVVRRAIEMETPDRLPIKLEADVPTERWGTLNSDVTIVRWNFVGPGGRSSRQTIDEWGCLWQRSEVNNMGQVKGHPLDSWSKLHAYSWPNVNDPAFYEGMQNQFVGQEQKYIITYIFMLLFERMHALRGYENCLVDFYESPSEIAYLADRIVEFDLGVIENILQRFPGRIHGLQFTDDWGTQQSLMINPRLWRSFFKPRYKILFDAIHAAGWHIWMHTDGRMNAILPDLLDLGLDVINLQQPRVNGIDEIGQQFRGRVCFESNVDIQATLPGGNPKVISAEAQQLLTQWSTPQGGFILSIDENESDLNITHASTLAMVDGFLLNDPWKQVHKER